VRRARRRADAGQVSAVYLGVAFVWLSGVGLMVVGNAASRGLERRRGRSRRG
jgi:hypothetical protein